MHKIIFFGNGPLADTAKSVLLQNPNLDIIFHAREKSDLETVKNLKHEHPDAFGVLASFGVLIKSDVLNLFAPEGILNIHPSLLPLYRGPSPIESAILNGDTSFSVSVMQLVKQMDAGPVYYQKTLKNLPLDKSKIYAALATAGATWLSEHLDNLPQPTPQDDSQATYTKKLDKSMSRLTPDLDSAAVTLRKIVAYQSFPKPKYTFFGQECIILSAHLASDNFTPNQNDLTPGDIIVHEKTLTLKCADGAYLVIDHLQPLSRKPMDARSFLNGIK